MVTRFKITNDGVAPDEDGTLVDFTEYAALEKIEATNREVNNSLVQRLEQTTAELASAKDQLARVHSALATVRDALSSVLPRTDLERLHEDLRTTVAKLPR